MAKFKQKAVYITYARNSKERPGWEHIADIVTELEKAFKDADVDYYVDQRDLKYGDQISEFENAIGNAECVILVFSERYFQSRHCMYEYVQVKNGLNNGKIKKLICIKSGNCNLSDLNYIRGLYEYWGGKKNAYEFYKDLADPAPIDEAADKNGFYLADIRGLKNFFSNRIYTSADNLDISMLIKSLYEFKSTFESTAKNIGQKKYNFFISYRRANNGTVCGSYLAGLLEGHSLFYDVRSITERQFDSQIRDALLNTEHFILVVTEGAFSRPETPGKRDWYYEEIDLAIKYVGLNKITPIIFNCSFNDDILPNSLKNRGLDKCQVVKYYPEYAEFFEKRFYEHFGIRKKTIKNIVTVPTEEQIDDDTVINIAANIERNTSFNVQGVFFKMVFVKGGTFPMGSNDFDDEKPIHSVFLDDFFIGETLVTQGLWMSVMGMNPSCFQKGYDYPVDSVSWNDIVMAFLPKLNMLTGKNFRLPTEAEWEYAARGGNTHNDYKYSGSDNVSNVAYFSQNTSMQVKQKNSNELGVYDMSGNMWEWCQDWYDSDFYDKNMKANPTGPSSGSWRVIRGGSWSSNAQACRVSTRNYAEPSNRFNDFGFRLVLPIVQDANR